MRITLDRALFDVQSEAEAMALLDLLSTAVRDIHDHALLTNPLYLPGDKNGEVDIWLSQRSSFEANAFRALLIKGILIAAGPRSGAASDLAQPRSWHLPGSLEIRVERRTDSDWRSRVLTLADAVDLLREPVHLVLENTRTEPAFMRHLAGPTNGATLRTLMTQPGRIATYGGGGGEAKKWIEALTTGAPTPVKWRRMLRTWILFDQDAGDPDARMPSNPAVELMNACEKVVSDFGAGLSWICLRRRELESYVPDSGLLAQKADKKPFVDQVIAWRNDPAWASWAWALDLKKGLLGDRHPRWSVGLSDADIAAVNQRKKPLEAHMLKSPFSGLSMTEIGVLTSGLGDALGEALRAANDPPWTSYLPAEYDRGPVDQVPRDLFVQSLFDRM